MFKLILLGITEYLRSRSILYAKIAQVKERHTTTFSAAYILQDHTRALYNIWSQNESLLKLAVNCPEISKHILIILLLVT